MPGIRKSARWDGGRQASELERARSNPPSKLPRRRVFVFTLHHKGAGRDGGAPATDSTSVQFAYDDEALYAAIMCYDPEPDKVSAHLARRDQGIFTSDWVHLSIDSNPGEAQLLDEHLNRRECDDLRRPHRP